MIYISCSDEEYEYIIELIKNDKYCGLGDSLKSFETCKDFQSCEECARKHIKRINTDITPDKPNYKTEAENKAFLRGFNVAVKKMGVEM